MMNGFKKPNKSTENLISEVPRKMDDVLPIASENFAIAKKKRG